MRMFDRDLREETEAIKAFNSPPVPAAVEQAIDTVARRLIMQRVTLANADWEDFADTGENDWERIEDRASEIAASLDRGQGPFEAAYELLRRRAERET